MGIEQCQSRTNVWFFLKLIVRGVWSMIIDVIDMFTPRNWVSQSPLESRKSWYYCHIDPTQSPIGHDASDSFDNKKQMLYIHVFFAQWYLQFVVATGVTKN